MKRRHLTCYEQMQAINTSASVYKSVMTQIRETSDMREQHTGHTRTQDLRQDRFIKL